LAEITLSGKTESITATGVSLGGGEIEITRINGCPVRLDGKTYALVLFFASGEVQVHRKNRPFSEKEIDELKEGKKIRRSSQLVPVFPFRVLSDARLPFYTAEEMFSAAERSGKSLWRLAIEYESALTGESEDTLLSYAEKLYDISVGAIETGLTRISDFGGVTSPKADRYARALSEGRLFPLGIADYGCLDALCIMEHSNAHGKIVCMPTGGASGIIPAAIINAGKELGFPKEKQIQSLMTAGLIGLFFYPTHYTGALGCQAEIGIAISMASAAPRAENYRSGSISGCPERDGHDLQSGKRVCAGTVYRPQHDGCSHRDHLCQRGACRYGSHHSSRRNLPTHAAGGKKTETMQPGRYLQHIALKPPCDRAAAKREGVHHAQMFRPYAQLCGLHRHRRQKLQYRI